MSRRVRDIRDGGWHGSRAVVIGGGPSLRGFDWGRLAGDFTIGTNHAFRTSPSVTLISDLPLMEKVQGLQAWWESDTYRVYHDVIPTRRMVQRHWEHVRTIRTCGKRWGRSLAEGLVAGTNTGIAAVNLADILGADPILLLGFDMRGRDGRVAHWHDEYRYDVGPPPEDIYRQMVDEFGYYAPEVHARVVVVNVDVMGPSALGCFSHLDADEAL